MQKKIYKIYKALNEITYIHTPPKVLQYTPTLHDNVGTHFKWKSA